MAGAAGPRGAGGAQAREAPPDQTHQALVAPQAQARGVLSGPQPVGWPAAASKAARSTTTRTCVPRATSPAGSATENQNVSRRPSTPSSRAVAVTTAPTGVGAT